MDWQRFEDELVEIGLTRKQARAFIEPGREMSRRGASNLAVFAVYLEAAKTCARDARTPKVREELEQVVADGLDAMDLQRERGGVEP